MAGFPTRLHSTVKRSTQIDTDIHGHNPALSRRIHSTGNYFNAHTANP
jgi:hypothetical protein